MPDNSFDIVSKIDLAEVSNAIQQALKEIITRYDLKNSKSDIELNEKEHKILLASQDEFKLKAVTDVFEQKLIKRKVPLKGLTFGALIPAAGSTVRQEITLQQGIPIEKAREIVKLIKDSKKKVQASIQGDLVRVSGRDRDTLQDVIALLRGQTSASTCSSPITAPIDGRAASNRCSSTGPPGRLEALLEEPDDQAPREAVLVCHPHPQYGGTMHNKVVLPDRARACGASGAVVLRFNYRGVNLSEGAYDAGVGELEDARAALEYLRSRYPDLPFSLAGFSFGSRIILRLGCQTEGATRLIAVGFPASFEDSASLGRCDVPRIFISSTHDEFSPVPAMEAYFASLPEPKQLVWIESADHFFAGALDQLEEAVLQATVVYGN